MTRVLLTGATGLLGGRLAELLAADFEVTPTRHRARPVVAPGNGGPAVALSLEDPTLVDAAFERARPEAVVHAAALANASACEQDPGAAHRINVRGTAAVAEACSRRGARLVLLSTDQVFGGDARAGVGEDDPTGPLMAYGRTKLAAEQEALQRCAGSTVLRIALVCGRGHGPRPSASEAVAWALVRGERLRLYTDEFRTPVDAEGVAGALRVLLGGSGAGTYHLGGPERVSRYELGQRVARAFDLDGARVDAVTRETFSVGPPRPADVSLDSDRARRELGYAPRPLEEMIRSSRPEPPPV